MTYYHTLIVNDTHTKDEWVCKKRGGGYERLFCLLLSDKVRVKQKTYISMSVWWKTKGKSDRSTRLTHTGWLGGLEHLKIKTRLTDERFPSVMVSVRSRSYRSFKLSRTTALRTVKVLVVLLEMSPWSFFVCLSWIDEGKPKDKTYIWVSVWWKTTN